MPSLPSESNQSASHETDAELDARRASYWRSNLRCLGLLLSIWFFVSFGCGILFVDFFNRFHLPGTGFKLGFWFAQQGSIYCFVVLVFAYAAWMNRLDRRFGVAED